MSNISFLTAVIMVIGAIFRGRQLPAILDFSTLTITRWSRTINHTIISYLDLKNIPIDTTIMILHQLEVKNIANVTFLTVVIGAISGVNNAKHLGFASTLSITGWSRTLNYSFISCIDLKNIPIDTKIMILHQIEVKILPILHF